MKLRVVVIALILSSCSAQWHIKKAIKKDPTVQQQIEYIDTLTLKKTVVDTVHTSDSTFYITTREISYDTTIHIKYMKYDFSDMKTWFQTWQEEKTNRVEIRNDRKENQTQIKQDNRTERSQIRNDRKIQNKNSLWWLWLCIGATLSLILRILWTKYIKTYLRLNK